MRLDHAGQDGHAAPDTVFRFPDEAEPELVHATAVREKKLARSKTPPRPAAVAQYLYRLGDVDRRVIAPRYAVGIGAPAFPLVETMHFEVGYAWGLNSPFKDQGVKWGVGVRTKPLRFPFTYAGVSARLKYERFWMDQVLDGFQLQLVFR